nr:LytTR family DNA-binding domain-containing protein [Amylibacter sp.]
MKTGHSSLALRALRTHLMHRPVQLALLGAVVVLGLSGPFGTFQALPALLRFFYWAVVVGVTYCTAYFLITLVLSQMPSRWPHWMARGISGAVAGPVVAGLVMGINVLSFAENTSSLNDPIGFGTLTLYCTLICATVTVLMGQVDATNPPEVTTFPPPLLKRLAFDKRGALVSLQAQDHYVLVNTTKGQQLVLMRIGDAMVEVGNTAGFQTHRSHWVAQNQIADSTKQGERGILTLVDGSTAPVSRNYMPALKSAGFFQ